jgi:hypothetical protein
MVEKSMAGDRDMLVKSPRKAQVKPKLSKMLICSTYQLQVCPPETKLFKSINTWAHLGLGLSPAQLGLFLGS